jgi:nicotinate-nucleotide adenylyltransferase
MPPAGDVGVFGGTFDPIHLGHLIAAEEARLALDLERVLFIPAGRPPHRAKPPLAPEEDRVRMVATAIEGHPAFALDLREVGAGRTCYTVETLEALRAELGATRRLHLVIGSDSLLDLPAWREPERIVELAALAVVERPGWTLEGADPSLMHRVERVPGARVGISSSEIRERLRAGRSVRYLVPDAVRAYIAEHRLYA